MHRSTAAAWWRRSLAAAAMTAAVALASAAATARGSGCRALWPTCMEPTIPLAGCFIECQPGVCPEGFHCTLVFATSIAGGGPGGCPGFVAAICLPDAAPPDVNSDGGVDELDLAALLAAWGPCEDCFLQPCPTDLTGDCRTGAPDLLALLAAWLAGS